jgi:uncharacterized protein YciI
MTHFLLAVLTGLSTAAPATTQNSIDAYIVFLKRGTATVTGDVADLQRRHLAHLDWLADQGYGLAAGPIAGTNRDIAGIVIVQANSLAQVVELSQRDPAVQAGALAVDVIGVRLSGVAFGKPQTPIQMEPLVLAVFTSPNAQECANPSQHPVSAVKGKRVLEAVVTANCHGRRAVAVYDLHSIDEARSLAEADAKSRSLNVELSTWYVPAGVLPR